jgi:hypothetical protein
VGAPASTTSRSILTTLRANRALIVVVTLVLLGTVLLALAQARQTHGYLDPAAVDPSGAGAVAAVLERQGVHVVRLTDTAEVVQATLDADTPVTLVIAPTAPLSPDMLDRIQQVHVRFRVLLAPDPGTLIGLAPTADQASGHASGQVSDPECAWDVATRAGAALTAGPTYTTGRPDALSCYDGSVVDLPTTSADKAVTVVGNADALTNAHLGELGNASLSLGVLGRAPTVLWWLPSPLDPLQDTVAAGDTSASDLVPSWVRWALLQLAVAVLVIAFWRGRRLGRVVVEPLPVVVRPSEVVEGRGRLYRRGNARGHAADALRLAMVRRLRPLLSLPRGADLDAVVVAAATRTGHPDPDIRSLLTPGNDPSDDAGLTRLATALDTLENEVRRS